VEPVFYQAKVQQQLSDNLMIFYTGIKRNANDILKSQAHNTADKFDVLKKMRDLVDPLSEIVSSGTSLSDFGKLLHENWRLKKSLTGDISSSDIDEKYQKAMAAGAVGGKLLGAGGGGFLLFYVEPDRKEAVAKALSDMYQGGHAHHLLRPADVTIAK
jgi:D-glycero-alpha-D-manno-heptose-7-phosphate kinase